MSSNKPSPPPTSELTGGLAGELVETLVRQQATVATAESLTGGLCAYYLVDEPGAGEAMLGSIVAYSAEQKKRLLGVMTNSLISERCASEMLVGVQEMFGSTCALSFTGVAGPSEQEGQPVGTVCIGVACGARHQVGTWHFDGDPNEIRRQAIATALTVLLDMLG